MIANEQDYRTSVERHEAAMGRVRRTRESLAAAGHTPDEIDRLTDPVVRFHEQEKDEIEFYERVTRVVRRRIDEWVEGRRDRIGRIGIAVTDRRMKLLVAQREAAFDRELTDALTELDLEIANDERFRPLRLSVMLVPPAGDGFEGFLASGDW